MITETADPALLAALVVEPITWKKSETHEGTVFWEGSCAGEIVGVLEKAPRHRYRADAGRGLVIDRAAPCDWSIEIWIDGTGPIPTDGLGAGLSHRAASKLAAKAIREHADGAAMPPVRLMAALV